MVREDFFVNEGKMATTMTVQSAPQLRFIGGDKIIDTMVSKEVMLGMLVGYLGMIAGLRAYMKGRQPYALTMAMKVRCP